MKEHVETEMPEMVIAVVAVHLARVKLVYVVSAPIFVALHVVLVVNQRAVVTAEIHAVAIATIYARVVVQVYVKHLRMVHRRLHLAEVAAIAEVEAVDTVVVDAVQCVKATVPVHLV